MKKKYVEKRESGYYVADTRVSLDSLVYEFKCAASPESIRQSFSTLTLEEVYGALTFYLANQPKIDKYMAEADVREAEEAAFRREEFAKSNPEFVERLRNAEVVSR